MAVPLTSRPDSRLALFAPPYEDLVPIDTTWTVETLPPRGLALVWWLVDGGEQEGEFQWLHDRPQGLPTFIVLPAAGELKRALPLLHYVNAVDPKGILPNGRVVTPFYLRELLKAPPANLATTVTGYLVRRGILPIDQICQDVRNIFKSIPETNSVSKLARRLYTSRRTLGRRFSAAGLPVPSHWLQFARLLHGMLRLQNETAAVFRVAVRAGYPDGFTMSNQMKRLLACRPTEVRNHLGWEWIVETWLRQEALTGGIDRLRYGSAVHMYLGQPTNGHCATSAPRHLPIYSRFGTEP